MDRITKILDCQNTGDLDIDRVMLDNLPINSNEPMFIAAECFKETLMEIGLGEDSAETARRAFLTLKRGNNEDETMNKIKRIASKISAQSSKSLSASNCAAGGGSLANDGSNNAAMGNAAADQQRKP